MRVLSSIFNFFSILIIPRVLYFFFKKENLYSKQKNILIIKLDGLGDYLLCDSFFRELRINYPEHSITVVLFEDLVDLASLSSHFDRIIQFPRLKKNRVYKYCKAILFSLKNFNENYEITIIPRWDTDYNFSSVMAFLSFAKKRIGFSSSVNISKSKFNIFYDTLLTDSIKNSEICHEHDLNLKIIEFLGFKIVNNHFSLSYLNKGLDVFNLKEKNIFVISLSAGSASRKWSTRNYIELIKKLLKACDFTFIIIGTKDDFMESIKVENELNSDRCINLVGKTTLTDLVYVISLSKFYFGPDTGSLHIASGFSIFSFVITPFSIVSTHKDPMHYNSPIRFGPVSCGKVIQPYAQLDHCEISCKEFFSHCINQISYTEVFDIIVRTISK
jgi:ADP-heptose:LPS heptosyltransferase